MELYETKGIKSYLCDNMEFMALCKDKQFSIGIVDPPYGLDIIEILGGAHNGYKQYDKKEWDKAIPDKAYFSQLMKISDNNIVFGGNYFTEYLPPSMGWIVWDKGQRDFSMADGELAWTSFNKALRIFDYSRGAAKASNDKSGGKNHPTQKPIELYEWLIKNYCKKGDSIIDTHSGSNSLAIAVIKMNMLHDMNLTLTSCEIDRDYWEAANKRIETFVKEHSAATEHPTTVSGQHKLF